MLLCFCHCSCNNCLFKVKILKLIWQILGATWAGEPGIGVNRNNETDDADIGYFERLGARTEIFFEKCFTAWGTWCANNPWLVLFLGKLF